MRAGNPDEGGKNKKRGGVSPPLLSSDRRQSYFEVPVPGAPLLGAAVEFFLLTGLACFLVLAAAGFAVLEVLGVLPAAGGLVCAAKVNGTMASASERVVSVFFIFFLSRRAFIARSQLHLAVTAENIR